MKKPFIITSLIILVALFIVAIPWLNGMAFIFLMVCREVNQKEVASSNNRYAAQIYDFGCPAGSGSRQRIKLIDKWDPTVQWKNKIRDLSPQVHTALNLHNENVVVSAHGYGSLQVRWVNPETLLVIYPKTEKIYYRERQWQDVTIVYQAE